MAAKTRNGHYVYLASIWGTPGYNVTVRGHNLTGLTALWMTLNNRYIMKAIELELRLSEEQTRHAHWGKEKRKKEETETCQALTM